MSRLAKRPIAVPASVKVEVTGNVAHVTSGDKVVRFEIPQGVSVRQDAANLEVSGENRPGTGLVWALLRNAVTGVCVPYSVDLEVHGVGYQMATDSKFVTLTVGFANRVRLPIPEGVKVTSAEPTKLKVTGADRQVVGQFCASLRGVRPPEPYKGKGIRYVGEVVRRKEGKAFGAK